MFKLMPIILSALEFIKLVPAGTAKTQVMLQAGGVDTRRGLLQSNVLVALAKPPAAQLWACLLETAEGDMQQSIPAFASAIVDACSNVAAMLFASALGI